MNPAKPFKDHPSAFEPREWRGYCVGIVDGDTFDVFVDLGLSVYGGCRIRLEGFDAPETRGADVSEDEKARGRVTTALVTGLILDKPVKVLTNDKITIGRYVGQVSFLRGDGWADLATELEARGAGKLPGDKQWSGTPKGKG